MVGPAGRSNGRTRSPVLEWCTRNQRRSVMTRLQVRVGAAAAWVLLLGAVAGAQQPAQAPPPITMKQLKPDVWAALGGSGGNSTVIIGKTGVIVVDAKQTEAGAKD